MANFILHADNLTSCVNSDRGGLKLKFALGVGISHLTPGLPHLHPGGGEWSIQLIGALGTQLHPLHNPQPLATHDPYTIQTISTITYCPDTVNLTTLFRTVVVYCLLEATSAVHAFLRPHNIFERQQTDWTELNGTELYRKL